jgi:hypothetical protein
MIEFTKWRSFKSRIIQELNNLSLCSVHLFRFMSERIGEKLNSAHWICYILRFGIYIARHYLRNPLQVLPGLEGPAKSTLLTGILQKREGTWAPFSKKYLMLLRYLMLLSDP